VTSVGHIRARARAGTTGQRREPRDERPRGMMATERRRLAFVEGPI
jgi:hypothetical protein